MLEAHHVQIVQKVTIVQVLTQVQKYVQMVIGQLHHRRSAISEMQAISARTSTRKQHDLRVNIHMLEIQIAENVLEVSHELQLLLFQQLALQDNIQLMVQVLVQHDLLEHSVLHMLSRQSPVQVELIVVQQDGLNARDAQLDTNAAVQVQPL